ncbi:MAG: MxaS protein [Methyloprofundus sp.]|nr:MxaS protein [Methyloprofundus sp.]
MENKLFYYRNPAQYQVFPGAHAAKVIGHGLLFKQHKPLLAAPDPRHLDLRASLLNPFSQYQVKSFQQQSRLDVFLLADLSASMRYQGHYNKQQAIVDCLLSVAQSAYATGDRFGFVGCGQAVAHQLLISPANLQQGRVPEIAKRIQATTFTGQADCLLQAADYLPNSSALVFLLSDFYMPIKTIQQQMQRLNQHTVVPLVLWDKKESIDLPRWGVLKFADLEQGKTRTLWMRPALQKKIQAAFRQRKQQLQQCFRSFGCEPLFMEQGYCAESVSQYFLQRAV